MVLTTFASKIQSQNQRSSGQNDGPRGATSQNPGHSTYKFKAVPLCLWLINWPPSWPMQLLCFVGPSTLYSLVVVHSVPVVTSDSLHQALFSRNSLQLCCHYLGSETQTNKQTKPASPVSGLPPTIAAVPKPTTSTTRHQLRSTHFYCQTSKDYQMFIPWFSHPLPSTKIPNSHQEDDVKPCKASSTKGPHLNGWAMNGVAKSIYHWFLAKSHLPTSPTIHHGKPTCFSKIRAAHSMMQARNAPPATCNLMAQTQILVEGMLTWVCCMLLYVCYDWLIKWQTSIVEQLFTYTNSAAQGGGGSFKNRKPIREVGCCESRMAERIHGWTERCLELYFSRSGCNGCNDHLVGHLTHNCWM